MAAVTVKLDADLEARVSKYADGIGVPLEKVCERAIKYALSSRYPDNELPGGRPARPDNALPGEQPEIDNSLPPFDGRVDNELPEGEVPVDPGYGRPGGGGRPDNELPDSPSTKPGVSGGKNPNPNPDADVDLGRPGAPKPEPK